MSQADNQAARSRGSRTLQALEIPEFRRFYLGLGISLIGSWLQAAAVRWIVFERTGSEEALGLVEAASILPGLVVGLFAGSLADRVAPKPLILFAQTGQMLFAFGLAAAVAFDDAQPWKLALLVACNRVFVAFEMPGRLVLLHGLVGRDLMPNAIALHSGLFNASRILGPALAGPCLIWLGGAACFGLNGLSYLAAIVALLTIRPVAAERPAGGHHSGILGGLSYLRSDHRVAALFLMVGFFGVFGMGYDAMVPAYARKVVQTDVVGYSLLMASSGAGATLGAFWVASMGGVRRKERLILGGLALFAVGLAGLAIFPPWIEARWPEVRLAMPVASACLLVVGLGAVIFYASAQSLIQSTVPDALRGRMMGIWMVVYSGSVPLGALLTGSAAQAWGVGRIILVSSVLCLLVAAVAWKTRLIAARQGFEADPSARIDLMPSMIESSTGSAQGEGRP
ncbi:MFS transporter [Isosphaeraceae bacterium EP7]